jgi:cytochrome c-type biogenesis protein
MLKRSLSFSLALFAAACGTTPPSRGEVGSQVPAYAAPTLAGDTVSLASLQGKPVLLNVWATWCPPCRKEMPDLEALHEKYAPAGLQVVGISIDAAGSDEQVRQFLEEYGVSYRILRDPGDRISSIFVSQGVPVTVLIGADGTVLWRRLGPVTMDDPGLNDALSHALQRSNG